MSRAQVNMLKMSQKIFLLILSAVILFATAFLIAKFSYLAVILIIGLALMIGIFVLVLKNPFLGLLLIVFTLPFERIPTLDIGFFTVKMDQVFAGLTMLAWILNLMFAKRKILSYPLGIPLILFLLTALIGVFQAGDFSRALSVFIFVAFMMVISFTTVNLIDDKEKLISLIKTLFISAALVCLFAFYQFLADLAGFPLILTGLKDIYSKAVMGFPRIQAFSMEPLYLANYLFIPLGLAAAFYFFRQREVGAKNRLLVLILAIILIIVLGISRGAYLALFFMGLFFALFLLKKVLTIKNLIISLFSLLIIGTAAYGFLTIAQPKAIEQFTQHATLERYYEEESVQKRLRDYQKALGFFATSPVIGIGLGNYGPAYENYPNQPKGDNWEIVNNQYIETLTETGVLGLSSLLLVFLVIIWRSIVAYFKTQDQLLRASLFGLLAAFLAILVQYNFFSTLYIMHIWVLIGLIIAVQNLSFQKKTDR